MLKSLIKHVNSDPLLDLTLIEINPVKVTYKARAMSEYVTFIRHDDIKTLCVIYDYKHDVVDFSLVNLEECHEIIDGYRLHRLDDFYRLNSAIANQFRNTSDYSINGIKKRKKTAK